MVRFAWIASVCLAAAPALSAGVIPVGPSGSFADLQPAIDAAQPGDVLLVEPGTYSPFVLSKPLRIYAQPGATIAGNPGYQAEVTGIPAGAEAVVHGLTLGTCPSLLYPLFPCDPDVGGCHSVSVHDNGGTVLLQSLDAYSVTIANCALVILAESVLVGRQPGIPGCPGSTALFGTTEAVRAEQSEVWIVGCTVDGGGPVTVGQDAYGGWGVQALDAAVYVAESTLIGGNGGKHLGACFGGPTFVGSPGKPGLEAAGASLIKIVSGPGQSITGGSGGASTSFCGGLGAPGIRLLGLSELIRVDSIAVTGGADFSTGLVHPPVETFDASIALTTSIVYPVLVGPAQASLGSAVSLAASGNPGATAYLYLSFGLGAETFVPGVDGAAALAPASLLFLGGATLDPAGIATFPLAVPPIPALTGFLGAFQTVEAGGPQVAFSNPVTVALFP